MAFGGIYRGRRVLVTGHTGFKGSWLALWLQELGAEVFGYALPPPSTPSHFDLLGLDLCSEEGDIRDVDHLNRFFTRCRPEIVFHLAAQPLVRLSYERPMETYATNVMGSLAVYEACRRAGSVRSLVSITTDKVYENREWTWGYREIDPMGGHDPYSASKACADLATTSYRRSFWPVGLFGKTHQTLLATARAGNVIGGGDWGADRLVPDLMRAAARAGEATLRNPASTRPWQHVLEPLCGYLMLGQRLWDGDTTAAQAWNFGPAAEGVMTVLEVVERLRKSWPALKYRVDPPEQAPHEANLLTLDCAFARTALGWRPIWDGAPGFERTAEWYRALHEHGQVLTRTQLAEYVARARALRLGWAEETTERAASVA
ncbi:MAG TPA: CDP-glucose 4,6-dehydratase [Polyangia bacterium]|jgi:CDP-glucose 4,6-dehydratase|nr:CDP-glucose 4,6-dehydratase [Polyangia bacterium]